MTLSEFKQAVQSLTQVHFQLPNKTNIPAHYHITEVGLINKRFIDCGGTLRDESIINFQLWYSDDTNHRLQPQKMLAIIELAESKLALKDLEIEVEYQADTIGKYGLEFEQNTFILTNKMTDCLAPDKCIPPPQKPKINLADLTINNSCCPPNGNCC
jgi:hypothetical protein